MELVVADDGSTDETPQIVRQYAQSVDFPVSFVTHPHETFQAARCRNEGVAASTADYLLFVDGDCFLPPDHVAQHLRHRGQNRVMIGNCYRLDKATSARVDDAAIRNRRYMQWVPPDELRSLARWQRKAQFYRWIRHPRKPKLLGGNVGVWRCDYQRVNGYDENYQGWGAEDDDLGIRLRGAGLRIHSIVGWTQTYHLWHPKDVTAPTKWRDGVNVDYFHRTWRLTRCMNGLVKRTPEDLALSVAGETSRPQRADAVLRSLGTSREKLLARGAAKRAEVEVLFLPGSGQFSGRAQCSILVVLDDSPRAARMARRAHFVVTDRPDLELPAVPCFKMAEFSGALAAA